MRAKLMKDFPPFGKHSTKWFLALGGILAAVIVVNLYQVGTSEKENPKGPIKSATSSPVAKSATKASGSTWHSSAPTTLSEEPAKLPSIANAKLPSTPSIDKAQSATLGNMASTNSNSSVAAPQTGGFIPSPPATASVNVNGQSYTLKPNQIGNFQRITVAPSSSIDLSVAFPKSQPGDVVSVQAEDGGSVNDGGIATPMPLDDKKALNFNFKTTSQPGIYRVTLRNGADVKRLQFWVAQK